MDNTLLCLFEQNEQSFRDELSLILLPRDNNKLQDFMNDFFVNKVSVDEYKKELTMGEIAMLNSVMKLVAIPISFTNNTPIVNTISNNSDEYNDNSSKGNNILDVLDIPTLGSTAIGGFVGSLLLKTWGGVLLSIAGCAMGMYISSSRNKQKRTANYRLDVDRYISTLKGFCKGIDEVILNYHSSVDNIIKKYENTPKITLATAYKPLLDRIASLFVAVNSDSLPPNVKSEFDKLFRTLKNHHFEILGYSKDTKEFFIETESSHVKEITIVKAAILENGKLLDNGECLIPENYIL